VKKSTPLVIVVLMGIVVALAAALLFLRRPTLPEIAWSATSGEPVPDKFIYLLFPRDASVEIMNLDGSYAGVTLDRAIMCTHRETHVGDTVGVFVGNKELRVPIRELSYGPDVPHFDMLVANWKQAVASWGANTDWRKVNITFEDVPEHAYRAKLWIKNRRGDEDTFVYQINGDKVTPEVWSVMSSKRRAFELLPQGTGSR
jgi:hypothetical protein